MASERLYGIGEPLLVREKDTGVKAAEYLRLVKAMGCNAWRCWMHLTQLLKDPETPDRDEVVRPYYLPPQYGIAQALDRVYSRIKSGKFWSDNTDDYFDLLAWHPYLMHIRPVDLESKGTARAFLPEPGNLWKDGNDAAYRVMCQYGDGHKQVLITEFGFTDCGLPDKVQEQAELTRKTFEMFAEMPYVRTVHAFRLLEDSSMLERSTDMRIGGLSEVYFGMFREPKNGCAPKAKALVIQQMAGGTEDLAKVGRSVAATVR
jgi:hypothetical protein